MYYPHRQGEADPRELPVEDAEWDEGADDPVWGVHHLADFQIDGHATEDVRLLAGEAVLTHQVGDHLADGLLGRLHHVWCDPHDGVVRGGVRLWGEGAA